METSIAKTCQRIWDSFLFGYNQFWFTIKSEIGQWRSWYLFRRPLILLLILTIALIWVLRALHFWDSIPAEDPAQWAEHRVALTGTVDDIPDSRPKFVVYTLKTETIRPFTSNRKTYSASGSVLIFHMRASTPLASPGDRLRVFGKIQIPKTSPIPGTFDYPQYLKNKNIFSLMYIGRNAIDNLGDSGQKTFLRLGWTIRSRMADIFDSHLPPEHSTVLKGLVLGQRPRFDPTIRKIFIESGTMHILVASGSNVAFVVAIWYGLAHLLLKLSRRWALLTSLPIIWVYVFIVGCDPPILRAGIMATIGLLAYLSAREDKTYHPLALAAFCLLIFNPRLLFDVGFLMSFVTVFGLLYFLQSLDPIFQKQNFFIRWLGRLMSATGSAQIWLLPISFSVFKRFFPIGFIANLFVLPLSGGGLFLGFLLTFCALTEKAIPPLGLLTNAVAKSTEYFLSFLIGLVSFFGDMPGLSFWTTPPHIVWVVGFYLLCLAVVSLKHSTLARAIAVVGLVLIFWGHHEKSKMNRAPSHSKFHWLDMGRHLAILIQTSEGKNVLFDPGFTQPSNKLERVLLPFLATKKIKKLDAVFITRDHEKVAPSLNYLKNQIPIKNVFLPKNLSSEKPTNFQSLGISWLTSSSGFQTIPVALVTYKNTQAVIAGVLSLQLQEKLLDKLLSPPIFFQSRFSEKIIWNEKFLDQSKPRLLIETGPGTLYRPAKSPWKKVKLVIPQKLGYFSFSPTDE